MTTKNTKRKLPEWMAPKPCKEEDTLSLSCDAKKPKKTVVEDCEKKNVQLTLAKARLAMSILAEDEENEREWEQEKIATDGNDSFPAHFDLEQCSPLMECMEVKDVLEVISKVKGHSYTRDYPHMNDREALMFDIDECFVTYCNMHGIRVQY
jgi:hypothetical protein